MNSTTQAMNAERLSIYDPRRDRMVSLNPYKTKAKEIYRHYIEDLGFDPSLVLPPSWMNYLIPVNQIGLYWLLTPLEVI